MWTFVGTNPCSMIVELYPDAHADSLYKATMTLRNNDCDIISFDVGDSFINPLIKSLRDKNDMNLYSSEGLLQGGGEIHYSRAFGPFCIWMTEPFSVGIGSHTSITKASIHLSFDDEDILANALESCLNEANAVSGISQLCTIEYTLDKVYADLLTVMNNRRRMLQCEGQGYKDDGFYNRIKAIRAEIRELQMRAKSVLYEMRGKEDDS